MKYLNSGGANASKVKLVKWVFSLVLISFFSACSEVEERVEPSYDMLNTSIIENNGFQFASFQTQDFKGLWNDHFAMLESQALGQIKLLVSYPQSHFEDEGDFFKHQPLGVSIVYEKEGLLYHKLYKAQEGKFQEVPQYELQVQEDLSVNTLRRLSYVVNQDNQSVLVILNQSFELTDDGSTVISENQAALQPGLAETVTMQTDDEPVLIDVAFGCMACGETRAGECKINDYGFYCKSGGCFASSYNEEAESKATSLILDLDRAREFRDVFLSKTTRGKEYIGYYETMSVALEEMSFLDKLSLAANYEVASKAYSILDKFTKGSGSSILITQEDKAFLLEFIDKNLMGVSRSLEYQDILQTVKNDLEKYTNLSVEDVRKDFNKGS